MTYLMTEWDYNNLMGIHWTASCAAGIWTLFLSGVGNDATGSVVSTSPFRVEWAGGGFFGNTTAITLTFP